MSEEKQPMKRKRSSSETNAVKSDCCETENESKKHKPIRSKSKKSASKYEPDARVISVYARKKGLKDISEKKTCVSRVDYITEMSKRGRACLMRLDDEVVLSDEGRKSVNNYTILNARTLRVTKITSSDAPVSKWFISVKELISGEVMDGPMTHYKFVNTRLLDRRLNANPDRNECKYQLHDQVELTDEGKTEGEYKTMLDSEFLTVQSSRHITGQDKYSCWEIRVKRTCDDTTLEVKMQHLKLIAQHNEFQKYRSNVRRR